MSSTDRAPGLLEVGAIDLLAVSVGNTRTHLGAFHGGRLISSSAFDNGAERDLREELAAAHRRLPSASPIVLGSVNPPLADRLGEEAMRVLGTPALRVERDVGVPIRRELEPGTAVGQDRLLDAAAAWALIGGACVVVDAGTAITVDLVDARGTFRGGAIAPGARLMLGALHSRTAQLPEVAPGKPQRSAGRSTAEAMRSGVYHSLRGLVFELAAAYGGEVGSALPIVATGGDAEWLFDDDVRIARIVPDLPLWGIALCWRAAGGEKDGEGRVGSRK